MYLYIKMSKSIKIHPEVPPFLKLPDVEKSKNNENENMKAEKVYISDIDNKLPKILSSNSKDNTILNLLIKLNKENMEKEIDFENYHKI